MRWETRRVWERVDTSTGEQLTCADGEDGAAERDTGDVEDVWYECESCSGRIGEQHKGQMLAAGRWVATRPGAGRAAGFHLSALYSPPGWFTWRQAVVQFLESQKDPGGELAQVFANTVLAEPWDEGGDQVDASVLEERIDPDRRPGSPVPRGGLILTAGVDVQHDRLEARVWAWGRGEESWLVAREIIFGGPSDDATWAALEELLFRAWPHAGGGALKVSATAIDAGDGNTTHWVRQFCRKWSHRHVLACKGQAAQGKAILGRPTDQDVSHKGKVLRGAVKMWPIGSDTAKAVLYARYEVEDGPGRVHLLAGLPNDELEQMTSERCVTRFVRGYPRREWTKPAAARNEALDCFVLALAAAHYAGVTRCNWDRLEAVLMQPDLLTASAERPADAPSPVDATTNTPARATRPAAPARLPARAAFSTRW